MERLSLKIDPYANDPGHWGASLITLAEIIVPVLDASGAKSVVEVGAYAGDLTGLLVEWAGASGARVSAIDPAPRQPIHEGAGVFPGEPGIRPGGLPYRYAAAREGGPRNGVLTAVEDFVADREGLSLAVIPVFFGIGVVWSADAPWARR